MLKLLFGVNWRANRQEILRRMTEDVQNRRGGRILLVPEQISHDYERRLCAAAGDSASRYGEVLSFTRLASRVFSLTGGGAAPTLDAGGRLLAMAAAVYQLRPQLKAYAAVGSKPEFLSALVTAVDEFKSCCIGADTLKEAAQRTEGALSQKLQELSMLLEAYNDICSAFGQDPRDRMTQLLEALETSDFAETHCFYIDGFSDFTAQEQQILRYFLDNSSEVTVSLVCDQPSSKHIGMELAGETASFLRRSADGAVTVEEIPDPEDQQPLGHLRRNLLAGPEPKIPNLSDHAKATRLGSVREECCLAAAELREKAAQGVRYREMALVCSDMEKYMPILRQTLRQYEIPAYFAGSADILSKSAMDMVVTALEAVAEDLDCAVVMRYLKSLLSPLTPEQCDRLENYAIAWKIRGNAWAANFQKHPKGLGKEWDEAANGELEALNQSRKLGITPLLHLEQALKKGKTVLEQLRGLYAFLEEVELPKHLGTLSDWLDAQGDGRGAQEQEQLWEILMSAMEQMAGLLGEIQMDADGFIRLFRLLLSQYDVGTIPQTLDSVTVGAPAAMRRQEAKYLWILGAQEDLLPKAGAGGLVLTEQERHILMNLNVPLQADLYRSLEQELAGIYAVVSAATQGVSMTCGAGQPAYVFRRLCHMLGISEEEPTGLLPKQRISNAWAAGALYLREGKEPLSPFASLWDSLKTRSQYTPGSLSPQTVRALYGNRLDLSASQVEKAASCQFAYFMRYGMKAEKRKELTVDPAEFGTFAHAVLEQTARQVRNLGGFSKVSLEETRTMAQTYAEAYQKDYFSALVEEDARLQYLFRRNFQELDHVVGQLWAELRDAQFSPAAFELGFGRNGQVPPVRIVRADMAAEIRGFVDRVDLYRSGGKTYLRVVDYKTGRKDFDYCDVLNGIGLQMLIYLFALEDEDLFGDHPQAAGVLYVPARAPILSEHGPLDPETAEKEQQKEAQRKGLLLKEEEILTAMDGSEDFRFLPVKRKKSGELSGDLATAEQFHKLKAYVMDLLRHLVNDIAAGNVEPNPYLRGDHGACTYCDYRSACHLDLWGKERMFKKIKASEFWAKIEEEKDGD